MRHQLLALVLGTALAGAAHAQPPWERNRGGSYGRESNVIDKVQRDLSMAARNSHVDSHERNHFERAMRELSRLEQDSRRGGYDDRRLDRVMEDLSHLAQAWQLDPRARRMMAEDLRLLQSLRGSNYGWRR